ncbi:MAG: hypothetical protein KIS92_21250 [Planctomycetota bacterium]|nr:hypothetical protein [Planctomycetota bacterium]
MPRLPLMAVLGLACLLASAPRAAEGEVVNAMDENNFTAPKEKAKAELVEGHGGGKAIKFSFENDAKGAFFMGRGRASEAWDKAAGFSFWVKGDGSTHCGGLEFVWNEDYAARYDYCFTISGTDWQKITVPWCDLIPAMPKESCKFLDPAKGNAPSKLGPLWVGKWWYWKDYAAHSFVIDDIRLEPEIAVDKTDYTPKGAPLERVLAKLKAGKPVTIVTVGDSLTDYDHWANKPVNWPTELKKALEEKYKSPVTIVNPAMGGTELRQNLIVLPRWIQSTPEPDLITVCFGGNDWGAGMRGPMFKETLDFGVDRFRRFTKGKSDLLLMTTNPNCEMWDTYAELADAARAVAKAKNTGLADIYAAVHEAGKTNREQLFCSDKVHLGPAGHQLFAKVVMAAIEAAGK